MLNFYVRGVLANLMTLAILLACPVWQQSMFMRTSLCSSGAIRCLT